MKVIAFARTQKITIKRILETDESGAKPPLRAARSMAIAIVWIERNPERMELALIGTL